MLRINRQTDYAIRVVLALSKRGQGARVPTTQIQQEMLIPPAFLQRIVAQLARQGLILTFAGREGGLELPHSPAEITVKDVVEAIEGPILLSQCMESKGEDDCPFHVDCPVRSKWSRVQVAMLREMASITFADLANESASL